MSKLEKEQLDNIDTIVEYVTRKFTQAFDKFKANPGGERWEELQKMMWVYQGVKPSGLNPNTILNIYNTTPIPDWIDALYMAHKDE